MYVICPIHHPISNYFEDVQDGAIVMCTFAITWIIMETVSLLIGRIEMQAGMIIAGQGKKIVIEDVMWACSLILMKAPCQYIKMEEGWV